VQLVAGRAGHVSKGRKEHLGLFQNETNIRHNKNRARKRREEISYDTTQHVEKEKHMHGQFTLNTRIFRE
jgi:hypothetical protein